MKKEYLDLLAGQIIILKQKYEKNSSIVNYLGTDYYEDTIKNLGLLYDIFKGEHFPEREQEIKLLKLQVEKSMTIFLHTTDALHELQDSNLDIYPEINIAKGYCDILEVLN